jgi:hypothetical protein
VSLNNDGTVLAVTTIGGSDARLLLFSLVGEVWTQHGTAWHASDLTEFHGFGFSAAISGDGLTMAVGAPYDGSTAGAVGVFAET